MARMISLASFRRNEVGGKIPAVNGKTAMKRGDIGDLHLRVDEERHQRRLVPWQCPLRGSLPTRQRGSRYSDRPQRPAPYKSQNGCGSISYGELQAASVARTAQVEEMNLFWF